MSTNDLVPIVTCTRCGADLEPGARFCANCGQEATAASASPVATAPVPTYWRDTPAEPEWRTPVPAPMPPMSAAFDGGGGFGKLFSGNGRIGRLEYFLTIVGVWVVFIIGWIVSAFLGVPVLTLVVGIGLWIAALIVSVCAGVKRLHDFDQSGWLYLLFLVPFVSIILLLILLFKGGSQGLNTYGYADSGSVQG